MKDAVRLLDQTLSEEKKTDDALSTHPEELPARSRSKSGSLLFGGSLERDLSGAGYFTRLGSALLSRHPSCNEGGPGVI
jgi:hypothetical protein